MLKSSLSGRGMRVDSVLALFLSARVLRQLCGLPLPASRFDLSCTNRQNKLRTKKAGARDPYVWRSGAVCSLGESDVEIYDGDIGEIGNYDYLFSSHCPTTTAF